MLGSTKNCTSSKLFDAATNSDALVKQMFFLSFLSCLFYHDLRPKSVTATTRLVDCCSTCFELVENLLDTGCYIALYIVHVSLLTPVTAISTRRHLRSADLCDLATPRTRTVGFGPRSFSAAGPSAWNSLPRS